MKEDSYLKKEDGSVEERSSFLMNTLFLIKNILAKKLKYNEVLVYLPDKR